MTGYLADTHDALLAELEALAERATRGRLVSATTEVDLEDPSAAVFASRLAGDRWFCWEQPDRGGFALAGVGSALDVVSRGPDRFADVARRIAEVARGRVAVEPEDLPAGAGPVWVGGFAFDPDGGRVPHWSSFPPARLTLPELALVRHEGRSLLTLCLLAGAGARQRLERLRARVASLRAEQLPLADPHPTARVRISSAAPPDRFEAAVAAAVERIRGGELAKVVLAREVVAEAPHAHDPAALFGTIRELFGTCFCFCVGTPEGAFVGASPELLVRRSGPVTASVALAGSTRRSADPAVDDHLGERLLRSPKDRSEHQIVARRIERALRRHSIWVSSEPEPQLVRVANIQHLATPIHAQLAEARSAVELAGLLHPTPAVGGEPRAEALRAIAQLEGMDRGWYAGALGWMDASDDGEFCVALRATLIRDRFANLYAGAGIVADSDPEAELAETELKLDALLPLLSG
jgi:salicylate biosynthesis isochorismate synthase